MTELVSTEGWGLLLPEELVPLTQTLISPALAAFLHRIQFPMNPPSRCCPKESKEVEEEQEQGQEQEQEEDGAVPRMVKRPRLVWTPQLHRRFAEAVHQLGVRNAVPKSIMQIMNVDGLTRENVASHLQKYRLYLKRLHSHNHNHNRNRHVPPSDSPFFFPFPLPSPPARSSSSSSSANLTTLVPQHSANRSHGRFPPFFSTEGYS